MEHHVESANSRVSHFGAKLCNIFCPSGLLEFVIHSLTVCGGKKLYLLISDILADLFAFVSIAFQRGRS